MRRGSAVGKACWVVQQPEPLQSRSWKVLPREAWTVPLLPRTTCWVTHVSAELCPLRSVDGPCTSKKKGQCESDDRKILL